MMDEFRRVVAQSSFTNISRGINVVALEAQPKDMIKLHADMLRNMV
jgi:pyruvate carboxylase subunit B